MHEVFFTCRPSVLRTQATFKRYQSEHKLKQDSLDRSKTDLKKLRRKSQGKSSSKYELKENEVSAKSPNTPVRIDATTFRKRNLVSSQFMRQGGEMWLRMIITYQRGEERQV